jgi:2-dehydro-3-deoxyphosphogluconate aldolase/(4S)-4-hydroxy-2-oxoglutarate aldolase
MQVLGFGCKVQKLFPADVHGPGGVKGMLAALPMLNMIVTGGVNEKTAPEFLRNGAKGVCVGSNLFTEEIWKNKDWKSLEKAAKAWLKA